MKNRHLEKAIGQQGLYEFTRQMKYKSEYYGIEFIEADRWYPSYKKCSTCNHVKDKLNLSERLYRCENCDLELDRDLNASLNLSKYTA